MKRKITYIISDIDKALAFEWIALGIDRQRFELSFILLNAGDSVLEQFLKNNEVAVSRITVASKKDWPGAWWKLFQLLKKQKPDVVHCHLLTANILGLSAAKAAGVSTRIYTRHHSSLHHIYHRKGVMWDKWSNRLATHIVAISQAVENILVDWEEVNPTKITLIPHGFDMDLFANMEPSEVAALQQKYHLPEGAAVIGVISRFTQWKGVQFIVPAFQKLLGEYPDAVLFLLGAEGDYSTPINKLLDQIPEHNKRVVTFEKNIAAAYRAMDVFVHVPIDGHSEAFGQIYVEALAAGVPSIFTLSGIAPDFIRHEENALVVPFCDSEAIYQNILRLLKDAQLRQHLKANGWQSVKERFALRAFISQLHQLYE